MLSIAERFGLDDSPAVAPVAVTLNPEEVRDAGADGVDIDDIHLSDDDIGFRRIDDGVWDVSMRRIEDGTMMVGSMERRACEALDRVREYWRRRALVDALAKEATDALDVALKAARAHAMAFAKIADDGVMSIDRAQDFRRVSTGFSISIREVERSRDHYRHAADLQAFKDEKGDIR